MDAPDALPLKYAAWRRRTLAAALVASVVENVGHGSAVEVRLDFGDEWPSTGVVVGLATVALCSLAPGILGAVLALASLGTWRRPRRSSRLARAAWVVWVLGPMPLLLLPVSRLFHLDPEDAVRTSAAQVRYLLTVTAPAFFSLLPGALSAALVLKRFLPESRAPGQIVVLAAPACMVAYLIPLAALAQLAFHPELYLGLLLIAGSPVVPLLAARKLRHCNIPEEAAHIVRIIACVEGAIAAFGAALLVRWLGDHPQLADWIGRVDPVWVLGAVAKVVASKWLTTVVVTDLLVAVLHQGWEADRAMAGTAEGEALARKLDALGTALRTPAERPPSRHRGIRSGPSASD